MMIRSFVHKYVLFWKCDFDLICCLETAMGRRKYHRGKRVRISGVQWCLSQVGRIIAKFFKSHSSDCKRNVEQTIHPPWYSNDLNEFPVHHQWNIRYPCTHTLVKVSEPIFGFFLGTGLWYFELVHLHCSLGAMPLLCFPIFSKWWNRTDWW